NSNADTRVTYSYNADGSLANATDALGNITRYIYNAFGQEVFCIKPGNNNTAIQTRAYDKRGLQIRQTDQIQSSNAIQTREYDAFGRVVHISDANGNVREQYYDRLGRLVQSIDPLGGIRSTTYDAFERVLTQTDELGNATTYQYDTAQRSITITTPE